MIRIEDHLPLQYPGPLSRQRTFKLKLTWMCLAFVGFGISLFANSPNLQSFGLGMMFPGAGFIHYAAGTWGSVLLHVGLVLLSLFLFLGALFLWFWNGNLLAPILVWSVSAVAAGLMTHANPALSLYPASAICSARIFGVTIALGPFISLALVLLSIVASQRAITRGLAKRGAALARRHSKMTVITAAASPLDADGSTRRVKELSPSEISAMRFGLDRALQPVDQWQGFHFGDQWQPAATRYQVNTLGWALALANHNALPSMRGYLQQAQLNLIEKKKDHRLWSYWRWENLWGNLRWNADPMPIDNIMYSGYLGMQIGMYQAATGDLRHDREGSFTLKHPSGHEYIYDFPKITRIVARQFLSDYCLWPCEPNMIYPACNVYGAIGLAAFDAVHGTDYWKSIEPKFREKLREEFTQIDGVVMPLKSAHTGIPLVGGGISSILTTAAWIAPLMPDLAAVQWAMAKADLFARADGLYRLMDEKMLKFPDPGSYKISYAFCLSNMLMAATEIGDAEVAKLCRELIDKLMPPTFDGGVMRYPDASIWAHAHFIVGHTGSANGMHDLVRKGSNEKWRRGPVLSTASYPDVLVAKAVSDGRALEAVLYPGSDRTSQDVALAQLLPTSRYRYRVNGIDCGQLVADRDGTSSLRVDLRGRTAVILHPDG